jgi:hypothetical protein
MNRKKNPSCNSLKIENICNVNTSDGVEGENIKKFLREKNKYIQEIIRNTIFSIKHNKIIEIFSNNDATLSINMLTELYDKTSEVDKNIIDITLSNMDKTIDLLQKIIDKLSMIICGFGTKNFDDLLFISFGSEFVNMKIENAVIKEKYELIRKYVNPVGYKIIHWKPNKVYVNHVNAQTCSNKLIENVINIEDSAMFECFDIESNIRLFHHKMYGIRIVMQNEKLRKTLIINGVINDIYVDCITNEYIEKRKCEMISIRDSLTKADKILMGRIIDTLSLKDYLIYGNNDIYKRMFSINTDVNMIRNNKLDLTIKRFLEMDTFSQRNILSNLLTFNEDYEIQYITYLLYDLISVNSNDNVSNRDQMIIYDSLPGKMKQYLKNAIKYTVKFTTDMSQKYDLQRITLEQQIYLLKAPESVKEKAMQKLKEIKGKGDETSSKAKNYLEGLVKIPFGIYKQEPILKKIKLLNENIFKIINDYEVLFGKKFDKKEKYTNLEMIKKTGELKESLRSNALDNIKDTVSKCTIKIMKNILSYINNIKKVNKEDKILISNQKRNKKLDEITNFVESNKANDTILFDIYDIVNTSPHLSLTQMNMNIQNLDTNIKSIESNMSQITNTLDESIYSHSYAKNQILKIIGQWINGEQSGYCFGFEGSPGIGKTSLAKKGLSNCLKDEDGVSRPFSFIALGGSSNGSLLDGHGYTYVNSTWGKIVDILMDSKCMNPIIYIDELDKVSDTPRGEEIIGILTHLTDTSQNSQYHDKYFSEIDFDLSKCLFIFIKPNFSIVSSILSNFFIQ